MSKRVLGAGLLGALVLMFWTFVVNGLLGFTARIDMRTVADEQRVYEILKAQVTEPGRYVVNPAATPESGFPAGEPVFGVLYGGVGHEAAGPLMLLGLAVFLLAPMIAAWLLAQSSERVLASFPRKLLFMGAIGLLFALLADLTRFGIAAYPLRDAVMLGVYHLVTWLLVGLAIAWRLRPA